MIGILPAGGHAVRMRGIHKMLLPIPQGTPFEVLCARMLQDGGARRVYAAVSEATHAPLEQIADRRVHCYRTNVPTMSEAVMLARSFAQDMLVLFGMPDTYFDDGEALWKLADALEDGADVAVGVFKTRPEQRAKLGMCHIENGAVIEVIDKPAQTDLTYGWGVLAWQPAFWDCMEASDPHTGYAIPRAIAAGMDVRAVVMDGEYWDVGTPAEYFALIRHLTTASYADA